MGRGVPFVVEIILTAVVCCWDLCDHWTRWVWQRELCGSLSKQGSANTGLFWGRSTKSRVIEFSKALRRATLGRQGSQCCHGTEILARGVGPGGPSPHPTPPHPSEVGACCCAHCLGVGSSLLQPVSGFQIPKQKLWLIHSLSITKHPQYM